MLRSLITQARGPSAIPRIVTWNLSEFNRLRFQYSYLSNNFSADKALNGNQFFVQWTTAIGAHTHGFVTR